MRSVGRVHESQFVHRGIQRVNRAHHIYPWCLFFASYVQWGPNQWADVSFEFRVWRTILFAPETHSQINRVLYVGFPCKLDTGLKNGVHSLSRHFVYSSSQVFQIMYLSFDMMESLNLNTHTLTAHHMHLWCEICDVHHSHQDSGRIWVYSALWE